MPALQRLLLGCAAIAGLLALGPFFLAFMPAVFLVLQETLQGDRPSTWTPLVTAPVLLYHLYAVGAALWSAARGTGLRRAAWVLGSAVGVSFAAGLLFFPRR